MSPRGDGPAVLLLALGQTLGFACLTYVFAGVLVSVEAGTGWSKAELALGPTLAMLTAAALAPLAGRLVDAGRAGLLLAGMPLVGAAGLVAVSGAHSIAGWTWPWLAVGVAQSGALYETCFAFLTRRLGPAARPAITRITLAAGFASTLSFLLGAGLGEGLGWRPALWAFAALLALVAAPANALAVARLRRGGRAADGPAEADRGALSRALRRPRFWALAAIFALTWMVHSMLVTYAVPLAQDRGALHGLAVTAAACIGPAQVAGRLALMLAGSRAAPARVMLAALAGIAAASAVLAAAGLALPLVFAFAVLQGAGIGVMSILRPVVSAELLGRAGFGAISGVIAIGPLAGAALAPALGAALLAQGGAGLLIAATLVLALVALGLAAGLLRSLAAPLRAGGS